MKYQVCVIASVLCLAACNKGPEVDVKNASGNEVAQAVRQSGVMSSDTMIDPGLWESKVTIQEMNIPGMDPKFAAKMKESIESHQPEASRSCLTKEDVNKPKEDFFGGGDKSCRYKRFAMGGGKMDIQMVCSREGSTQTSNMTGTYTPTSYAMDMATGGSGGTQGAMVMKMHIDGKRVGECTAKG
jgi:Protein of unknown function (DUF3617)